MANDIECTIVQGIVSFSAMGYFQEETGKKMVRLVDEHLAQNRTRFIIDFSLCPIVNSPGLSHLMEVTFKVVSEFKGAFVVCGLDALKHKVFSACGVIPLATEVKNFQDALKHFA